MSLTYTTYVASLINLAPTVASDTNFATDLPNIIDDAEQRLYRELDLENTVVRDTSGSLTAGTSVLNLPSSLGTFVVVQQIIVNGTASLSPLTKEALGFLYPSSTGSSIPTYMAPVSQSSFIVGPWPNQSYSVAVTGTIRPAPLSSSNVTTLLSVYFPDLLIAASMVRVAGYMKNYGAAVDDPQQGVSWETHYQKLFASAATEEARKKFTSAAWSDKQPTPLATPPRV